MFPFPILATTVPPAICTVAIWKNPLLTSGRITSVCPETVYPMALLFSFQKQCDFRFGWLAIVPNNQNKQCYRSLHGESEHICRQYSPSAALFLFCQLFFLLLLFFIKSCLILLLFNDFMTTGLWGFFHPFFVFRLRSTQRYNQVLPQYLISHNYKTSTQSTVFSKSFLLLHC